MNPAQLFTLKEKNKIDLQNLIQEYAPVSAYNTPPIHRISRFYKNELVNYEKMIAALQLLKADYDCKNDPNRNLVKTFFAAEHVAEACDLTDANAEASELSQVQCLIDSVYVG